MKARKFRIFVLALVLAAMSLHKPGGSIAICATGC